MEFERGIERFIELHGDLDVAKINRGHVREFRDAAQLVPAKRSGKLLGPSARACRYSRKHPDLPRIKAATINKWLNCLGAVLNWARNNGILPATCWVPFGAGPIREHDVEGRFQQSL